MNTKGLVGRLRADQDSQRTKTDSQGTATENATENEARHATPRSTNPVCGPLAEEHNVSRAHAASPRPLARNETKRFPGSGDG